MKRRLLASCLLPIALVLASTAVDAGPSAAVTAPPPVRIMINGDSITQQFTGDYTWRYRLGREFARQGSAVDFVGRFTLPHPGGPYRTAGWDMNHFAVGGMELSQFLSTQGYDITGELGPTPPDVLVSFLGSNDLTHGIAEIEAKGLDAGTEHQELVALIAHVVDEYGTFVDLVREKAPDIKIVLGQVTTHRIAPWIRTAYNQQLEDAVVLGMSDADHPITLARLNGDDAAWGSSTYTYDLIHPTPTGEMLIAQRFAQALHALGDPRILPAPPAISQAFVPWTPSLAPALKVYKRRIYLDASRSTRAGGVLAIRVNFTTLRSGRSTTGAFRKSPKWHSTLLRPGRYRVKIQGLRAQMTSTWSRAYYVRVPRPR